MADFPDIPAGFGIPLVDMTTKLFPDPTMDALSDVIDAGVVGSRVGLAQVNEDFSLVPDGQPAEALTGQAYKLFGSSNDPDREPYVDDGFLVRDPDTDLGSYAQVQVSPGKRINHVWMQWKSPAESVGGAVAVMALMEQDFVAYTQSPGGVPRSPFHFLTNRTDLWVTHFLTAGGSPSAASPVWSRATSLVYDDSIVHTVQAWLDTDKGWAYIEDATGKRYAYQDDAIRDIPAYYAFVEDFKDAGDPAGKAVAKFKGWGASTVAASEVAKARARWVSQALHEGTVIAGSSIGFALTSTHSRPTGDPTAVAFRVPPSKRVLIEAEFMVDVTVADSTSEIRFGLMNGSNSLLTWENVAVGAGLGSRRGRAVWAHSLTEDVGAEVTRKVSFAKADGGAPSGVNTTAALVLKPQVGGYLKVTPIA